MRKLHIGFDMDGILTQLLQQWVEDLRHKPGVPSDLSVEHITSWNITECEALKHLDRAMVLDMMYQPFWFTGFKPIDGAKEALERLLKQGHTVEVITATPGRSPGQDAHVEECKRWWLRKHLPCLDNAAVHFKQAHEKVQHHYDVLVEDHPGTMVAFAKAYPRSLVLGIKYPYNQHIHHTQPNTLRTQRDYEELLNHDQQSRRVAGRSILEHVCAPRDIRLASGWNDTKAAFQNIVREIEAEAMWQGE